MSNVYIENSTLVVPSLFFDGFAWILIINWLIIDSRGFTKHVISMHWQRRRLWRFWHYKAKFVPFAFFGNLSPQNFHPRQISLWQHDGLATLFVVDSIGGRGKTHSKDQTRLKLRLVFLGKDDEGQFEVKDVLKNHQITVLENHQKNPGFRAKDKVKSNEIFRRKEEGNKKSYS